MTDTTPPAPRYRSIFRPDLFAGEVALVTGGGTGIGRCIAHELASLGATVVVVGRREEPLAATVAEIADAGGRAEAVTLNIRDEDDVDRVVAELVARHGRLDHLVNNAGGQFASPAALIKPKGWRAVIDTNLNGTWLVTQACFKHAFSKRGGAIVSIVADMWNGFPGMAHTGAARAAVVNLTMSLAVEWAAAGVRVNAVAPGFILSSGLKSYPPAVAKMAHRLFVSNPAARPGTEAEVSAAVAFLLSPAAAFITGETLKVDGAASLHKAPLLPLPRHSKLPGWDGFHLEADLPEIFADLAPKKSE
ncbi:MAG: SDR family oxidoreductase [Deltaproteobacteria bacterium]|nr:MAG: SDR family oxidoreductase [Deltaproteobacteria bacterium]